MHVLDLVVRRSQAGSVAGLLAVARGRLAGWWQPPGEADRLKAAAPSGCGVADVTTGAWKQRRCSRPSTQRTCGGSGLQVARAGEPSSEREGVKIVMADGRVAGA